MKIRIMIVTHTIIIHKCMDLQIYLRDMHQKHNYTIKSAISMKESFFWGGGGGGGMNESC